MPLRSKYPITDWVLSRECVQIGDIVAFYCEDEGKEVHATVIGFPSEEHRQYISVKRQNSNYTEVINYYDTIVYFISGGHSKTCSCGAKYTNNPKFHLSYCDLAS